MFTKVRIYVSKSQLGWVEVNCDGLSDYEIHKMAKTEIDNGNITWENDVEIRLLNWGVTIEEK